MGFLSSLVSTVKNIIPVAATVAGGLFGGATGAALAGRLAGGLGFRGTTGQGIPAAIPVEQVVGPLPTITTVQPPPSFSFNRKRQRKLQALSARNLVQAIDVDKRRREMGLFDFIGSIGRALAGPATTTPAIPQTTFEAIRAQAVARANLSQQVQALPVVTSPLAVVGGRGNGFFATSTTVQTVELATGRIVRTKTLNGSPFLMNNEVNKLRTVARKLGKANARLPRKTRRASAQRELVDAVTQNALRRVITDGNCPS